MSPFFKYGNVKKRLETQENLHIYGVINMHDEMSKEMEFFIYLIECYAEYKGTNAKFVMDDLESLNLTDFIFNLYEMYHAEAIENAFLDIDKLIEERKQK